jgi:hypothetical protein
LNSIECVRCLAMGFLLESPGQLADSQVPYLSTLRGAVHIGVQFRPNTTWQCETGFLQSFLRILASIIGEPVGEGHGWILRRSNPVETREYAGTYPTQMRRESLSFLRRLRF